MTRVSINFIAMGWFLASLMATGCTRQSEPGASSSTDKTVRATETVVVAAAANLKFAFEEIESAFEQQHPEVDLLVTCGSSGNFFAQISQNAPFDIFFSADTKYPKQLIENGLAAKESCFSYASGQIVVWVPNESRLDLEALGIRVVLDAAVRKIAMANPRLAPYGAAAEEALKKLEVFDEAGDKLVFGESITQTAHFVESGAADLGILALSLALAPGMKEKGRYWIIPADAYSPIDQAAVILNNSKNPRAASLLRKFVVGPNGQAILARFGYAPPKE